MRIPTYCGRGESSGRATVNIPAANRESRYPTLALTPDEAAFLGGKATLSTHENGKPKRRLWRNLLAEGLEASSPFLSVSAFLAILLNLRSSILDEDTVPLRWLVVGFLALAAIAFAAPVFWGLREETVEMGPDVLRVRTGNNMREFPWGSVRQLRATLIWSYFSRRLVVTRPAVIVKAGSGEYVMKWWRFTSEEQKQFFNYAASRVLPAGTPVIDDLHWLAPDKALSPVVRSEWARQYRLTVKAGLVLMVIGLVLMPGFWIDAALVGAIGAALMFIGLFAAFVAWAALTEERRKNKTS